MIRSMDSYEIKRTVGVDNYDQGKRIFDDGGVGPIVDLGHNLSYSEINDGKSIITVTIRSYPDDHEPDISCDCHGKNCRHITSLLISMSSERKKDDDPDVIAELEDDIDNLYSDITSDDDYDEEANCYEEWEMDKYGLTNDNDSVEYDHTYDICKRIVNDVSDPITALRLFDRLHRVSHDFEYDNGGFDDAVSKFDKELKALFTYADPEVTAEILTSGPNHSRSWAEKYMKYIPKEIAKESEGFVGRQGTLNKTGLETVLRNRDYDTYIDRSSDKIDAYITVIRDMRSNNDGRVREYAERLYGLKRDDLYNAVKIADEIWDLGFGSEAADIYVRSFIKTPDHMVFDKLRKVADDALLKSTSDRAVQIYLCGEGVDIGICTELALCGRCKEVDDFIRKVGFKVQPSYHRDTYSGAESLCCLLVENDYTGTAARLAHDAVEYYMNPRNAKNYCHGVAILRFLDSEEKFERIEPKHSVYLKKLREERRTMRKFWGMYDGTWVGKERRDDFYW